jgi:predicted ferric reductase
MLHLYMFILIMITVGMHRPEFSSSTVIIIIFTACLWVMDRPIRGAKIMWNFYGNYATVTALPNEALRVKLSRRVHSNPGSHAFLWVPAIRWVESHPFTLLSSTPSEFVIRVYGGFTRDLYRAAQQAPGMPLRCSVDGPYGQVPNFRNFEKVVLVAGGSGASFTFSVVLDLIESNTPVIKSIDFIWVVRNHGRLYFDIGMTVGST